MHLCLKMLKSQFEDAPVPVKTVETTKTEYTETVIQLLQLQEGGDGRSSSR